MQQFKMADIKDGLFVLLVITAISAVNAIKCYKCSKMPSNNNCSQEEHVQDCNKEASGDSRVYDVCQTIVFRSGTPDVMITKKCAIGPCELGSNQNKALDLECSGHQCIQCCNTDQCNYSAASVIGSSQAAIFGWAVITMAMLL